MKNTAKKIDAKLGKGFCKAVVAQTCTPVLGGKVIGGFVKEAAKAARYHGLNGPMRMDHNYTHQEKCDMYVALFQKMSEPLVSDIEALHKFEYDVLYKMIDDGMFQTLNYAQFINQMKRQFVCFGVKEELLDLYLENKTIQKEMKKLWNA